MSVPSSESSGLASLGPSARLSTLLHPATNTITAPTAPTADTRRTARPDLPKRRLMPRWYQTGGAFRSFADDGLSARAGPRRLPTHIAHSGSGGRPTLRHERARPAA